MTTIEPRPLCVLIGQLRDLDVDLPPEVVTAASVLEDAASGELKRLTLEPAPLDLLHADKATIVEHIRSHAARRLIMDTADDSAWQVSLDLAQQAGDLLAEHADDVIAQLRPAFEQATAAFSAAVKAGLHAGVSAEQVIDLGAKAIAAWRTLPEHAATLDHIASARIAMSDTLGVAPGPNPWGPRQYGAAFAESAPRWDTRYSGVARWLYLSASQTKPLTLLSLDQTEQAAQGVQVIPVPIAPGNAEAMVTSGSSWLR